LIIQNEKLTLRTTKIVPSRRSVSWDSPEIFCHSSDFFWSNCDTFDSFLSFEHTLDYTRNFYRSVLLTLSPPGILIFYQHFQLWWRHKKSIFCTFWCMEMCFLKKIVRQILLSNLNHYLFLKFWNNLYFWIKILMCKRVTFLKILKVIFSFILIILKINH
jgi:hypothetical protein